MVLEEFAFAVLLREVCLGFLPCALACGGEIRDAFHGECKLNEKQCNLREHFTRQPILQMPIKVALSHGELVDLRIKVAWS